MNKKLDLTEILKGHEGETFYSSICGTIVLLHINSDGGIIFKSLLDPCIPYAFNEDGTFISGAECVIFPSKDQRDWNKWLEEQKPKVPKTWKDILNNRTSYLFENNADYCVDITGNSCTGYTRRKAPIEKSALALLKIHQLIEVGYGGNVSKDEFFDERVMKYVINLDKEGRFYIYKGINIMNTHIAFHTKEQAEEFLKYPENVQLLKDYFMIN